MAKIGKPCSTPPPDNPLKSALEAGFTLIELSIVLVIIGLIVGGVLVGKSLVSAAEVRTVLSDIEKYKTAVNTFRIKFDCVPGDCSNATMFLGTSTTGCSSMAGVNPGSGTGTCNGDGDSAVGFPYAGGDYNGGYALRVDNAGFYEKVLFWQQLSLASLIQGTYSGRLTNNNNYGGGEVAGIDVPTTARGAMVTTFYETASARSGTQWDACPDAGVYHIQMWYAASANASQLLQVGLSDGTYGTCGAFSPLEVKAMDSKIDDGNAHTGKVIDVDDYDTNPLCVPRSTGVYSMTDYTPSCAPLFIIDTK